MVNNGSVSPKRLTLLLAAPSLGLMFVICINSLIKASFEELQRFEHPPKDDGSLSLLVIGDWGRNGHFNQSKVALQMGRIGEKLEIDFVISTGDNFYENGLNGVGDLAFEESFTKIYTAKSLQKQWYSRNHNYRGDTKAQLSPVLRKINSRWLSLRSFIVNAETTEFFFVDTTPFVVSYFFEKDHTYDWQGVFPRGTYLANLLNDLEMSLRVSSAKWKIVVGHHAIRGAGNHGDTPELIHPLLPLLEANNVDFYINGHDHSLEHISSKTSAIQFLTSRAGSKAWRVDMKKISNHAAMKMSFLLCLDSPPINEQQLKGSFS